MLLYWLKALHLIAMVAWFAGLFYMFRLFVYHAENQNKVDVVNVLKVMESRLLRIITIPAMIVTVVFGLAMLYYNPGYLKYIWIHIKLLCVLLLIIYTMFILYVMRRFHQGDVFLTSKQCRFLNEVPTLLLIAIILLAVLRPF